VTIAAGAVFAGYRIETEIGRGGMGIVYRARHLALDRERALKLISPALSTDSRFRDRFQRESRLAASLEHPNVVPVDHAGDEGGILYLSMRLVEGSDLRRIVEAEGPLDLGRAARLLAGVAAGLDAAHARGLVHRDVKPANVLIEPANGDEHVFLTDFGISRIAARGGTVTSSGELLGSPDYVAPEQIAGDRVDHRADIYGLGCLLHFVLTGQPPFPRDNDLAKLFAHANAPRPRPSELLPALPTALDRVLRRAMAISPQHRYDSARQLAADVERVARGAQPLAADASPPPGSAPDRTVTRRLRRSRPRPLPAILAACVALVAAGTVAALLLKGRDHGGAAGTGSTIPRPRSVATVSVGRGPTRLAVGPSRLWVASSGASALYAIDLATNQQAGAPVPTGGNPVSVVVAFGSVWALDRGSNTLLRLDPLNAPIKIPVGTNPWEVTFNKHWVWVANRDDDTVSRVDPATNQVNATVPVDAAPTGIATGAGGVWVASAGGGSVSKINRATVVGNPIPIGKRPNQLAVGDRFVWVSDASSGTVTRISPRSMHVVGDPIEVGDRPTAVATGVGYVWVANGGDSTVSRIDPRAAAVAGPPIRVGRNPVDVAVGKGAVWTANFDDSTVTRIRP
jgi:serine/threonine-protein kinase